MYLEKNGLLEPPTEAHFYLFLWRH